MDMERSLLTAQQVMHREVIVLRPDQEVVDAAQVLLRAGISGAPVVDGGRVVGMFSERDCLTVVAAAAYEHEPSGTVRDHMRTEFDAVGPGTDVFWLARHFRGNPVRRLPVVDDEGRLLGLVLRSHVLRALHRVYCARAEAPPAEPRTTYERVHDRLDAR